MAILERAKISSFSTAESMHRVALFRAVFENAGGRRDPTRRQFDLAKSVCDNLEIFGNLFDVHVDVHAQDFRGFGHSAVIDALSHHKLFGCQLRDLAVLGEKFQHASIAVP